MKKASVLATAVGFTLLLAMSALFRAPASAQDKPAATTTKWEFKVLTKPVVILPQEEAELNKLGEEGWELAAISQRHKDGAPTVSFVFKRAKR